MTEYQELVREGIIKHFPDGTTTIFNVDAQIIIVAVVVCVLAILIHGVVKN